MQIGKKNELNIKYKKMYWLMRKNSQLALNTEVLLYKSILKPIWLPNLETTSESNKFKESNRKSSEAYQMPLGIL